MRILLAIIGAAFLWMFRGFRNSFFSILYGADDGENKIPEDLNIWIGLTILLLIGLILNFI